MKINELQNGQVVRLRLGRYVDSVTCDRCHLGTVNGLPCEFCGGSGRVEATGPAWSEWQDRALHIGRDSKGRVCTIALEGGGFAEFDPRQIGDFNAQDRTLCAEDYYMQIEGLEA